MGALVPLDRPLSTSNLVQPSRASIMRYARDAYDGAPVVAMLESRLSRFHQTSHCITLCSGFWALVLAIRLLARPGRPDLLMPSLTYRRMADVASWSGLHPRFCEVDPDSLACSPATMRAGFTSAVALLLAVHPIVGCCDAPGLVALSEELGCPLLFDSVESVFEHAGGKKVGSFGTECFSLHASKLLNGFEGGYVTTDDDALADRLRQQRDGAAPDGMDVRLEPLHAAMALAGLDELDDQLVRNQACYESYRSGVSTLSGIKVVPFPEGSPTSHKTIVVELTDDWPLSRDTTVMRLNEANILARAYYHPPLHARPMAYAHRAATLPVTDRLGLRFMLLPCGHHVSLDDVRTVIGALRALAG